MDIFGKHIFGDDAKAWINLCKESKKEWILKYTSQKNETLIDEFINNPNISKECKCLNCGKNGNKSNGVSKKVTEGAESVSITGNDTKGSTKRQRSVKTKKN
jgi:hypothetical protein